MPVMSPAVRKAALLLHVGASVGWLGAISAFVALVVFAFGSNDTTTVRSCYVAADVITRLAIVPLCFAALLTGLVQSLGTAWGLVRNYWVIAKLLLTLAGTGLLLLHTGPIAHLAEAARDPAFTAEKYRGLQAQLIADGTAAIVLLLITTGLSIYKPTGLTPYGWRMQRQARTDPSA